MKGKSKSGGAPSRKGNDKPMKAGGKGKKC